MPFLICQRIICLFQNIRKMKEKLRYCIEYVNPRFPLLDSGNLNIRHLRVAQEHFAEIAITLILSFGGKIISTYKGSVARGRVSDWAPSDLELEDRFSQDWLNEITATPKIKGWAARESDGYIYVWEDKPIRDNKIGGFIGPTLMELPKKVLPEIKWPMEPIEVELTISRK